VFDPKKLLNDFLGAGGGVAGGVAERFGGGALGGPGKGGDFGKYATGAAVGGIAALLMGSKVVRNIGGAALGYGGAAVLGGLAYKAWQDWQAGKAAPQAAAPAEPPPLPPPGSRFDLAAHTAGDGHDSHLAIVRAMIAAAKADGHIDAAEQKALFERIGKLGLDAEAKAFVMDELGKPLDIAEIAALAGSPEQAAELWLASRIAVDPDDPRERAYLDDLARRLSLPPDLVAHLERQAAG
jgi:uncharacterized membrane protein YebE (DUF533 family)